MSRLVLENVCYPMELNGVSIKEAKVRAAELLDAVGIDTGMWKRSRARVQIRFGYRVSILFKID